MVLRVCTTKMRELPADLEDKKATSIRIGRALIFTYKTPAELVIGRDETDARFVNHASRTREAKGAKRCKILGKGSDKAQITVTIFVTESGEELPYQMIFEGKTVKCHPLNQLKPADCLWACSAMHRFRPTKPMIRICGIVGRNGCIALHYYVHFLRIFSFVTRGIESEGIGAISVRCLTPFDIDMTLSSIPTFSRAGWALHKRSEAPYRSCTNTLTFDPTSDERENT